MTMLFIQATSSDALVLNTSKTRVDLRIRAFKTVSRQTMYHPLNILIKQDTVPSKVYIGKAVRSIINQLFPTASDYLVPAHLLEDRYILLSWTDADLVRQERSR